MADGADLADVLDDFAFAFGHDFDQLHKGFFMGGEGHVIFHFAAVVCLVADAAVHTDALAQALGQYMLVGHIHQLVLQGRAPRIDNQYFHSLHSL